MVNTVVITQEDLIRLQQNVIDSLKDEISNGNSSLKNEINNLKDTESNVCRKKIKTCDKM